MAEVKLVASMIVRNELDRYLDLCVSHLLSFVNEIRVLDDGSDDGTFEWLDEQDGVFVKRNPGPSFYEYESKARQELLNWTIEGRPTYVLGIDADEFVGDPERLLQMLRRSSWAYTLHMEEVWQATPDLLRLRVDGSWGPRPVPLLWHAPQALTSEWLIPDRKLACGREPLAVRHHRARPTHVSVYHFGWARLSERDKRYQRYVQHDQGKFHADAHLRSIMWPDDKVRMTDAQWPAGLAGFSAEIAARASRPAE